MLNEKKSKHVFVYSSLKQPRQGIVIACSRELLKCVFVKCGQSTCLKWLVDMHFAHTSVLICVSDYHITWNRSCSWNVPLEFRTFFFFLLVCDIMANDSSRGTDHSHQRFQNVVFQNLLVPTRDPMRNGYATRQTPKRFGHFPHFQFSRDDTFQQRV